MSQGVRDARLYSKNVFRHDMLMTRTKSRDIFQFWSWCVYKVKLFIQMLANTSCMEQKSKQANNKVFP